MVYKGMTALRNPWVEMISKNLSVTFTRYGQAKGGHNERSKTYRRNIQQDD